MRANWRGSALTLALVVVVAAGLMLANRSGQVQGEEAKAAGGFPRYAVVDTEGTNLVVVDNGKNTLYFYTVEPGKECGDDLHLRGSIDLSHVGKAVLKAKKHK